MTKRILVSASSFKLTTIVLFLFFTFTRVDAQRSNGQVGIGFQAGYPTGLSLQFFRETGMTTDLLFAYDFRDFFFVNVHGLWDTHLDDENRFHLYYGPGAFLGVRDNRNENTNFNNPVFGFSGNFGLNLVVDRVEFFGQVTPRLSIVPGTDVVVGGGVGLRFFL